MTEYNGPERRDEGQRVVINAVKNGAQADVDELLRVARRVCVIAEQGGKWLRRIGWILGIGFVSFVFSAGMWYFKVNNHIESDTAIDLNQDEIILSLTEKQSRILGVLEQMDVRLEHLEGE